jgi:membrane fusion protein, copper/silver efflux system
MKEFIQNLISQDRKFLIIWISFIVVAFLIGLSINSGDSPEAQQHGIAQDESKKNTIWTCSMHPNIQQPKPGKCPICGMDLIPVETSDDESEGPREISLSKHAQKLAEIITEPVARKFVEKEIRLVGKIEYDETRVSYITTWIPGRIDKLFVNYTGISVNQGQHLAKLYSPEILSTHQELLQSLKTVNSVDKSDFVWQAAQSQLNSVRERLRLWGLTKDQIAKMEKSSKPNEHISLYAPISGIVIHKNALEGMYVNTGTKIFTIADLSKVWVKMDAYESDVSWLRYGQDVKFTTEAFPGEVFPGRVAFIDPVLDAKTRTIKIRVNVNNPEGKLKPEMFVHGIIRSKIAENGKIMNADLSGKWISPMHPEIIKNKPGKCDICGMPLVQAEALGYANTKSTPPLVIPASAPLITGKRAVVYVKIEGKDGAFEGREINLGLRTGDYYIVKSGVHEGEKIVVNGNFKIDSAIQITAKPSMMNPEGGGSAPGHNHGGETKTATKTIQDKEQKVVSVPSEFKKQLDDIYQVYFDLHYLLSRDNFEEIKSKTDEFKTALKNVDMKLLDHESHLIWMDSVNELKNGAGKIQKSSDINQARKGFDTLSKSMIEVAKMFGSDSQPLLVYHCPMAFDNTGADWLQNKEGTENPYFGSSMFSCGDKKTDLTSKVKKEEHGGHKHE